MIWRDINEMRADVKMLLAQSNIDKTRIENLQKDVKTLQDVVYKNKIGRQETREKAFISHLKLYFKHEEVFDLDKYLKNIPYES